MADVIYTTTANTLSAPVPGSSVDVVDTAVSKGDYKWYVYHLFRANEKSSDKFQVRNPDEHAPADQKYLPLKTFFPLINTVVVDKYGKRRTVPKPKFLNYIFVNCQQKDVEELISDSHLRPMQVMGSEGRAQYQTISEEEIYRLEMLDKAVDGQVTISMAGKDLLGKGDTVKILNGPMKDMEGILRTSQGKSGGDVFITLTYRTVKDAKGRTKQVPFLGIDSIYYSSKDIKPVEFAKGTNHFDLKMAAFKKVLDQTIANRKALSADNIPSETLAALKEEKLALNQKLVYFLERYNEIRNLSRVYTVELAVVSYTAAMLLGDTFRASRYEAIWKSYPSLPKSSTDTIKEWTDKIK